MTPYERVLTVRMQDTDHDVIRYFAYLTKTSMNEIVTDALREYFVARRDEFPEEHRDNMRRQHKDDTDRVGAIAAAVIYPDGKPAK